MDTTRLAAALAQAEADSAPEAGLRAAAAALRHRCAPLPVVAVDAQDMRDETPAFSSQRHSLYLGASDGHCWRVTQDPAQAAGLFIATRH